MGTPEMHLVARDGGWGVGAGDGKGGEAGPGRGKGKGGGSKAEAQGDDRDAHLWVGLYRVSGTLLHKALTLRFRPRSSC